MQIFTTPFDRKCASLLLALVMLLPSAGIVEAACTSSTPCASGPIDIGTLGGPISIGQFVGDDGKVYGLAYGADFKAYPFVWESGVMSGTGAVGPDWALSAMSRDGSTVVGISGNSLAFRWTGNTVSELGTLGGDYSYALGVSADGSAIVGWAEEVGGRRQAFRWLDGTMYDLGMRGAQFYGSQANAISDSGSVVVGQASDDSGTYAFRWVKDAVGETGTTTNLGVLPNGHYSDAIGLSADGSVVIGTSDENFLGRGFRWVGGTMTDLGTLGGDSTVPFAISADGRVVIGESLTAENAYWAAFRWKAGTMSDLGTLGGATTRATSLSDDGSVIVGYGLNADASARAFRWTQATGMRDLNDLMTGAGVNLAGAVLFYATDVSGNGQFITGMGLFGGQQHAFVARYVDGETEPADPGDPGDPPGQPPGPVAGITTFASVEASIKAVGRAHDGVMAQQHGFATALLGGDKVIDPTSSEVGTFASAGSAAVGGFAHYAFGDGLALLAGVSYAREDYDDAEIDNALTGALALRYVVMRPGWQPFVEGGGWYAPNVDMAFGRSYANGAGLASTVGRTNGDLAYVFGRAGVLVPVGGDQLAVSVEAGRERLEVAGYGEQLSASNPFEAMFAATSETMDLVKARVAWTHQLNRNFDATVWISGVHGFNREGQVLAAVSGFGLVESGGLDSPSWVEYGGRLGFAVTETTTLDVFANGVSGERDGIGTRVHGGAGVRFQF